MNHNCFPYDFFSKIDDIPNTDKSITDDFNMTSNKIELYIKTYPYLYKDRSTELPDKHTIKKNLLHKKKNPIILRILCDNKYKLGYSIKFEKNINRHLILFNDGYLISTFLENEEFDYIANYTSWVNIVTNTYKMFNPIYTNYGQPSSIQLEEYKEQLIKRIIDNYNKKEIIELKIINYLIRLCKINLINPIPIQKYDNEFLDKMITNNPEMKDILIDVCQTNSKYNTRRNNDKNKILDLKCDNKFIITPTLQIDEWLNLSNDLKWFSSFFESEITEINKKKKLSLNVEINNLDFLFVNMNL
jgi:hypothetical protein